MRHGRKQGHPVRVGSRVFALASAAAIAAALAAPAEALAGGAALYRLYNPYDGQHLLTTDGGEYDSLQPLGWRGEGEAWEAPAEGDPVYRLFNPYASVGTHLLTTDRAEYESLQPLGWRGEGVAFYATHTHTWEPVYQSTWVQDSAAWDEPVYSTVVKYRCNGAAGVKDEHGNVVKPHVDCGKLFDSLDEYMNHDASEHDYESSYSTTKVKVQTGTKHHDATGHYEQQVTGYRCAGCGATK